MQGEIEEKLIKQNFEICNAKITSVTLSMADHGCLTFAIRYETPMFHEVSVGSKSVSENLVQQSSKQPTTEKDSLR